MSDRLRLLILNWRYLKHPKAGGAEVWTQRLAEGFVLAGNQVTVFTAFVRGQPEHEVINGVTIIRRGNQFTVYMRAKRYLKNAHRKHDVVLDEVNTRPFFAFRFTQLPVITMFHQLADDVWDYEMIKPLNYLGRFVLEPLWLRKYRDQHVYALSHSTAKSLQLKGIQKVSVIEPGVDSMGGEQCEKGLTPTLSFLGRLVPSKRPLDAIRAFELLAEKFPDARLYVIGDGPLRSSLEERHTANVQFVGHVDFATRNRILQLSHVLIATSVREGWGMNVTEASIFNTLTIAYDVPGLRDSVSVTKGRLSRESVNDLAAELIEYFEASEKATPRRFERTWSEVCVDFEAAFQLVRRS
jgi:glycosyltransferase involved in cell wall biosynthesis